jgi:hypothetical protein
MLTYADDTASKYCRYGQNVRFPGVFVNDSNDLEDHSGEFQVAWYKSTNTH